MYCELKVTCLLWAQGQKQTHGVGVPHGVRGGLGDVSSNGFCQRMSWILGRVVCGWFWHMKHTIGRSIKRQMLRVKAKWNWPYMENCWLGDSYIESESVGHSLCDPMDYSTPGSSVLGISQARILDWVTISFFRGSSRPKDQSWVSCIAGRFFTVRANGFLKYFQYLFILCIWLCAIFSLRCGMWDLVPWPGIQPRPPALGVQSPSHWTTSEVPGIHLKCPVLFTRRCCVFCIYFTKL